MLSTALGVPQEFLKDSFSLINLGKDEIAVLSVESIQSCSRPVLKKFCDTLACEFNVEEPAKRILEVIGAVTISQLDLAFVDESVLRSFLQEHNEVWVNRRAAVQFLSGMNLLQRDVVTRVAEQSAGYGQPDLIPDSAVLNTPKPSKKKSRVPQVAEKESSKRSKRVDFDLASPATPAELLQFPWVTAPVSAAVDAGQSTWVELVQPQHLSHGLVVAELMEGIGIHAVAQVCEGHLWLPRETNPTFSLPEYECWVLSQQGLDALGDQLVADDWPAYFQPAPRTKSVGGFVIQRPHGDKVSLPSASAGTHMSPPFSPVSLADSFFERLRAESQPPDRRQADRLCAMAGFVNLTRGDHVAQRELLLSKNFDPKSYNVHASIGHALGDVLEKLPAFQTLDLSLQFLNFQFVSESQVSSKSGLHVQAFLADTIKTTLQLVQAMNNVEEASECLHNAPNVPAQRRFIADGWTSTKEALMFDKQKTGLLLMPVEFQLTIVNRQLMEASRVINSNVAANEEWDRGKLYEAVATALVLPVSLSNDQMFFLANLCAQAPKKVPVVKDNVNSSSPAPADHAKPKGHDKHKKRERPKGPAKPVPATPLVRNDTPGAGKRRVCHKQFLFHFKAAKACDRGASCTFSHDIASLSRAEGMAILDSLTCAVTIKDVVLANLPA